MKAKSTGPSKKTCKTPSTTQIANSSLFNTRISWIPADRDIDFDFAQKCARVLGENGVDIKTAAPFETGDPRQPRDDFEMPVVVGHFLRVERGGVNDVVV